MMREGLSFDDVLLVPRYSELGSRESVTTQTHIGVDLDIPIVSSPMDTVTESDMAVFIGRKGGLGFIHRYCSIEHQVRETEKALELTNAVGAAIGVNGDSWDRARELIEVGANPIIFDVANGATNPAIDRLKQVKDAYPEVTIISGNLASADAAAALVAAGADALRVGIGAGSACTTRMVAGVGVPQFTAIHDVAYAVDVPVIADGGIRSSADIVKALAAGADAVMLGGLLATYPVSAKPGIYRGMASLEALIDYKGKDNHIPEGEFFTAHVDEHYEETFNNLIQGVRLGMAYMGAADLEMLRHNAEFIRVTANGYREGLPHFKGGDR
jgi:IMP dehydrogenase